MTRPVLVMLAIVLCVLVLLPIGWLVAYAFVGADGKPTLANFVRLASDPAFSRPLLTSLRIAISVALLACAVSLPLAWLVARSDMPMRRTVRALVTASFVTPPFLGAIAWEILAAPNSGVLNQWARALLGLKPFDQVLNIYTAEGVTFVITLYAMPYAFVLVTNALERIPAELEQASAILGGSAWRTLRRVTIPLVAPALLAGGLVAFLQAMTLFGSPAILALPAGFHVHTTKIWSLFQYPPAPHLAAAAALPLLALTVGLLVLQRRLLGRRGYTVIGDKSGAARTVSLGRWRWAALAYATVMVTLPVLLPYGALLKTALVPTVADALSLETLTFKHVRFVFLEFSQTRHALWNTVLLGLLTATLGTLLALVVAYITGRKLVAGHQVLGFLATAPVAIPGIVLGVGLFLAYTRPPVVLYGTLWILLLAFLTIELPAGYQQMRAAFSGLHPELEEASRILGATRLGTLRRITAPLLRTSVVAAWCFIFIGTIRELSAAIMLSTANTKIISVVIYDLNESGDLGAISVLGLTLLLVTFTVVILVNRLTGLGRKVLAAS
ncbi:MAG: iron ABC transporter permease [Alphaproteobacteria bacterium]|nr:iron ABC transporter permease [Alphaproteobacteria bacterium]